MALSEEEKQSKLEDVAAMVSDSEISSIKNVTSGIVKIINDPNSNARNLKAIIEIDPPLTAKVLRTANSAYYYSRRHISDIEEAVIWIGFDNLKELALSQKVCEIFKEQEKIEGYSRLDLWTHCIAVGTLAKLIYRMEFGESGENIYAAGLLHDIGIIIEDQFFCNDFARVLEGLKAKKSSLAEAEYEFWGYSHADIGSAIAKSWQFPEELQQSIKYHHNISDVSEENKKMTITLTLADYLCHECGFGYRRYYPQKGLLRKCMDYLGVRKYALDMIVEEMKTEMNKMKDQGLF